jgi:hypothetical protein
MLTVSNGGAMPTGYWYRIGGVTVYLRCNDEYLNVYIAKRNNG